MLNPCTFRYDYSIPGATLIPIGKSICWYSLLPTDLQGYSRNLRRLSGFEEVHGVRVLPAEPNTNARAIHLGVRASCFPSQTVRALFGAFLCCIRPANS